MMLNYKIHCVQLAECRIQEIDNNDWDKKAIDNREERLLEWAKKEWA